jgi:nitrogen regulatory protein P-II 1
MTTKIEDTNMNEIIAIIQSHTLSKVMHAMYELPHFPGVTVADVRGQGRGRGKGGSFQPTEDNFTFHKKTQLTIACEANQTDDIVKVITQFAQTGNKGDGLITVKDLSRAIRIRTGENAGQAV